jgi:S-DNA-T family DNA segregation ATPase FtsK/SpoIIIE
MQATMKNKTYVLPPMSLLASAPEQTQDHVQETEKTAQAIEQALHALSIPVHVVKVNRGPRVTQYEVELLDKGMRVNKLASYEKDLSLALGVSGIRIEAPLKDKQTIGVEVPNAHASIVNLKSLLVGSNVMDMELPVCIGATATGEPLIEDLSTMPHVLVAGSTGTGKSVCLNSIIISLMMTKTPDDVRFLCVDPKLTELASYDGTKFLLCPVVTDMNKVEHLLKWACEEMDNRYAILRKAGARSIKEYNASATKPLHRIVIVLDEFADMMLTCKEAESYIVRIASKARAAGLHLILTTQRPSANVVTGLIKANMPARICFRVADRVNSRVVFDRKGAEQLLGKGDCLYLAPGTGEPVRAQGVYVSDAEISAVVQHVKAQGKPSYVNELVHDEQQEEKEELNWTWNPWFHECMKILFKFQSAKASTLIRHARMDAERAQRFIEEAERIGLVSADIEGSRYFKKTFKQWLELLVLAGNDVDTSRAIYKL